MATTRFCPTAAVSSGVLPLGSLAKLSTPNATSVARTCSGGFGRADFWCENVVFHDDGFRESELRE